MALGLALPFFLAPWEYAKFSLNLALIQLLANVAFEWIRVSVLRFAGKQDQDNKQLCSNLKSLYIITVMVLLIFSAILGIFSIFISVLVMPALIFAIAALQGAFDGRSAWARAEFENVMLAKATLVRPALSLTFVIGLAMATGSGIWAMTGMLISYPLSSLVFRDKITIRSSSSALSRTTCLSILRFGAMSAIGTNAAMAVPALLRMIIVAPLGLSNAGGALLAFDISQRIFSTVGMALNLFYFQALIRVIDNNPIEIAIKKARGALSIELMLFGGIVTMITVAIQPIATFFAPLSYEIDFARHLPTFSLLMAILCLRQYAIDTLFIAFRELKFIAVAPIITLFLFSLSFIFTRSELISREYFLITLLLASAVGLAIPVFFIGKFLTAVVPFGTFAASVLAACFAITVTSGITNADPIFALVAQSGSSLAVYCTTLGAVDLIRRLYR